jgi:hypothetical protein
VLPSIVAPLSQPETVSITLGIPLQLMHENEPDALGMSGVPDQPLTPILQPDSSYRLFISGGEIGGTRGGPGLISTKDFMTYRAVVGSANQAQPVLAPSCRSDAKSSACEENYDAQYAGVDLVFSGSNGKDLVMIYQGTTKTFGGVPSENAFYSVVALATSSDEGLTWTRQGPIITGSDPKPISNPKPGANGADQSGAIVANGSIYDFYPYFPSYSASGPTLQVARAPLPISGPGNWTKFYNGSFGSQPGIGGLGSQVVPSSSACTRPVQPWLASSAYLGEYVMVFVCQEGWFFTTSPDLTRWSAPIQFYSSPTPMFSNDQPTEENLSLVTPGNPGQVIGQSGYILYASTPSWGKVAHMLWMRSFTFNKSP